MHRYIDIKIDEQCTSINFPDLGTANLPKMSICDLAYQKGKKHAANYSSENLLAMLENGNIEEVYEAFGAISRLKLRESLQVLMNIVFFDEDIGIKREAIRTIRRIGGKKAMEILRSLKTSEHRAFVEEIIKTKNPDDVLAQ